MNQPKPMQVRLPFSVTRPKKGKEVPARVCGICRTRDSRYVCPRCNVAYCGLDCFRSEKHNQCSEPFYKETVMRSISSDDKAGWEEKKKMMEMLQRFENGEVGDGLPEESGDGAEDDGIDEELAEKLDGVDLDGIDSNALFHLLPPEHRTRFLEAIKNPESEETKYLLDLATADDAEAARPDMPTELPWWEAPDIPDGDDDDEDDAVYAQTPLLVHDSEIAGISPPTGVGLKLAYNAMTICLAYLHVLLSSRLPSLAGTYLTSQDTLSADLRSDISALIPFLPDQKSTIRYNSAREAYSAVWEAIGLTLEAPSAAAGPTDLLLRLLGCLPGLLHPPLDTASSPRIFHLLADLYRLYSTPRAGPPCKKLGFYLVALRQLGRADWIRLEKEVEREIRRLEGELGDQAADDPTELAKAERSNLLI